MNSRAGWTPDPDAAAAKPPAVHDPLTAAIAQLILQRTPPPPAFSRSELAGADRHLQRTPRREASRGASREASRGVKGDVLADAGRSPLMSRDFDLPSPAGTGPHGRPRGGPAADQAGLW